MVTEILLKRVYETPSDDDGYRILVDRLWPRGVSKASAQIDHWAKEFTPSKGLREWFHAEPGREKEFAVRYLKELEPKRAEIEALLGSLPVQRITLVTSTDDLVRGHSAVLAGLLRTIIRA